MAKERTTFSTRRFLVGTAGPFPRLVFREDVILALDRFSHTYSQGEHGGFLIGRKRALKSAEQYEIIVERFVPIPQKEDASRLVINQGHYISVLQALQTGERPEEIVGWAHTHPGFGVFLSNFDKEQHQRFFPEPWQVAYVMDNQASERAAFRLVDGEWDRLTGYYVLRDMADDELGIRAKGGANPWLRIVLGLLVLAMIVAGGTYAYTLMRQLVLTPEPALEQVETEPTVNEPVIVVETRETPSTTPPPPQAPVVPVQSTIAPPSTVPRYVDYVVEAGDTLWSIADDLWGDGSLFNIIIEENELANPSILIVGTVLRVPIDPEQQ